MTASPRQIVTLGGGFKDNGGGGWVINGLVEFLLRLVGPEPRVCLMNTATGDDPRYYSLMYGALAGRARVHHLALFPMPNHVDPEEAILSADIVLVGGGSVANEVAVWRTHGLDGILRRAWESGVILSGSSAGAICWFEAGTTDSFGRDLKPFTDGLGLLPGSYCPHYNSEEQRRPAFHRLVADGTIAPGWAADDGVALHWVDRELVDVIADRDGVAAYRVDREGDAAVESKVEPRRLQ
ncbi:MAG TPA: peptidase E [Acidimicrobiales bacterium]|nr:peptidase E [Acidimicrobiales bacterium]